MNMLKRIIAFILMLCVLGCSIEVQAALSVDANRGNVSSSSSGVSASAGPSTSAYGYRIGIGYIHVTKGEVQTDDLLTLDQKMEELCKERIPILPPEQSVDFYNQSVGTNAVFTESLTDGGGAKGPDYKPSGTKHYIGTSIPISDMSLNSYAKHANDIDFYSRFAAGNTITKDTVKSLVYAEVNNIKRTAYKTETVNNFKRLLWGDSDHYKDRFKVWLGTQPNPPAGVTKQQMKINNYFGAMIAIAELTGSDNCYQAITDLFNKMVKSKSEFISGHIPCIVIENLLYVFGWDGSGWISPFQYATLFIGCSINSFYRYADCVGSLPKSKTKHQGSCEGNVRTMCENIFFNSWSNGQVVPRERKDHLKYTNVAARVWKGYYWAGRTANPRYGQIIENGVDYGSNFGSTLCTDGGFEGYNVATISGFSPPDDGVFDWELVPEGTYKNDIKTVNLKKISIHQKDSSVVQMFEKKLQFAHNVSIRFDAYWSDKNGGKYKTSILEAKHHVKKSKNPEYYGLWNDELTWVNYNGAPSVKRHENKLTTSSAAINIPSSAKVGQKFTISKEDLLKMLKVERNDSRRITLTLADQEIGEHPNGTFAYAMRCRIYIDNIAYELSNEDVKYLNFTNTNTAVSGSFTWDLYNGGTHENVSVLDKEPLYIQNLSLKQMSNYDTWRDIINNKNKFWIKFEVKRTEAKEKFVAGVGNATYSYVNNAVDFMDTTATIDPSSGKVANKTVSGLINTKISVTKRQLLDLLNPSVNTKKFTIKMNKASWSLDNNPYSYAYIVKVTVFIGDTAVPLRNEDVKCSVWLSHEDPSHPIKKYHYMTDIETPKAELKCDDIYNESYEAMAGFPATTDLYFASGGDEYIADCKYDTHSRVDNKRTYTQKSEKYDNPLYVPVQVVDGGSDRKTPTGRPAAIRKTCPNCGEEIVCEWYAVRTSETSWDWKAHDSDSSSCGYTYHHEDGSTSTCSGAHASVSATASDCHSSGEAESQSGDVDDDSCGHGPRAHAQTSGNWVKTRAVRWNWIWVNFGHGDVKAINYDENSMLTHLSSNRQKFATKGVAVKVPTENGRMWNSKVVITGSHLSYEIPDLDDEGKVFHNISWDQELKNYSYNKITGMTVLKLDQASVSGMSPLFADESKDIIKASILNDVDSEAWRVAQSENAEGGRLYYSFMPESYDEHVFPKFSPSSVNACEKCVNHMSGLQLETPSKNGVGQKVSEVSCDNHVVSDYLVMRTRRGDVSICFNDYKVVDKIVNLSVPSNKKVNYSLTPRTLNFSAQEKVGECDTTFADGRVGQGGMSYSGYNGECTNPYTKYTSFGATGNINIDDADYAINQSGYPMSNAKTYNEPGCSAITDEPMRLQAKNLDVHNLKVPNEKYEPFDSNVFYKQVLNYPNSYSPSLDIDIESQALFGNVTGAVIPSIYTDGYDTINPVIVHDPVSTQKSVQIALPESRDQRTASSLYNDQVYEQSACPGDPNKCQYASLRSPCKFNGTPYHTLGECITDTFDGVHHVYNISCSEPHHAPNTNYKYYVNNWVHTDGSIVNIEAPINNIVMPKLDGKQYDLDDMSKDLLLVMSNGEYHLVDKALPNVDVQSGATLDIDKYTLDNSTYLDCVWPVTNYDNAAFDTKSSKYSGHHYTFGDDICWKACNNDTNHQHGKVQVDDTRYEAGDRFVNLDYDFSVYFPNIGDFYGNNALGVRYYQDLPGKGYIDNMEVSRWLKDKYIITSFDVIYDKNGDTDFVNMKGDTSDDVYYKAGEKIHLGKGVVKTNPDDIDWKDFSDKAENSSYAGEPYTYHFYVPLKDSECSQAYINCYAVGENSPYDTWYMNNSSTNYERVSGDSKEDASKQLLTDIVGRIGGLTMLDTGDFRYSNLFKEKTNKWLMNQVIYKVDPNKQFKYLADQKDIRGLLRNTTYTNNLDTYGTQFYKNKERYDNCLDLPLVPYKNNIAALNKQPQRVGYMNYMSLETIGNYYGDGPTYNTGPYKVQIRPYYYYLDLSTGKWTKMDIYMKVGTDYKCINYFDNDKATAIEKNPYKGYEWLYSLNWREESARRQYTAGEKEMTDKVVNTFTSAIPTDDASEDLKTYKLLAPSGSEMVYGTGQCLFLRAKNRTFIGGPSTYKFNLPTSNNEPVDYGLHGQRWHFSLGLPSSARWVPSGTTYSEKEAAKWSNNHSVIVMTVQVYAKGYVWTLKYDGTPVDKQKLKITPTGKTYDYSSDPNGPGPQPIITVFKTDTSSIDDVSIRGTH